MGIALELGTGGELKVKLGEFKVANLKQEEVKNNFNSAD